MKRSKGQRDVARMTSEGAAGLKAWLAEHGRTMSGFARSIGFTPAALNNAMLGKRGLSVAMARQIHLATSGAVSCDLMIVGPRSSNGR